MYSNNDKLAILCAQIEIASKKFYKLLECLDDEQDYLQAVQVSSSAKQLLGETYSQLVTIIKNESINKIVADMDNYGVVAVTCFSQDFPRSLVDIDDPPYILFCKGDVSLLKTRCLAVVGTRKVSSYGRRVAKDFTTVLSDYFTVVSGLAYGVDTIAHETTLDNDGKTIAVLGGGLINVYPATNLSLAERIVSNGGLILSEYGMRSEALSYHFPHRNRIVSGLSQGLLVCQAPAKSGTSSTVQLALEQGKDIFVVPGEVYDLGYSGSNALIKSMQGACVTTPRDIVDYYGLDDKQNNQKESYQLSFDEQLVVDVLSIGQLSFDDILEQTKMPASQLNYLLANLELKSVIARLPGNVYRLYGGIK